MSDTPQFMTLTPREMAIAKWISDLSEKVATDDRHQIAMLAATSTLLATVDIEGNLPELTKEEERFTYTIKQGCEARGAKRAEAAVAALAVALAAVVKITGRQM